MTRLLEKDIINRVLEVCAEFIIMSLTFEARLVINEWEAGEIIKHRDR